MSFKNIENVSSPVIYIFGAVAVSCISYGIYDDFNGLAILIAVLFFIYIFFYFGVKFALFISIFFAAGLYINVLYYNVPTIIEGDIRIVKINDYEVIGSIKGRNVCVDSDYEFICGSRYNIKGVMKYETDKYKGVVGRIENCDIEELNDDFLSRLYEFKNNIFLRLKENIGTRKAGLIASMAFGDTANIDDDDKDNMRNYGIIHSISVSGLHVALVYGVIKAIAGNKIGILTCGIYVLFTGCGHASIRAFIMLVSVVGSEIFKKNNNSLSSLSLSGLILLIYRPYSILEVSFHLSYLATLGIVLLNKYMNYKMYKFPKKLRENLSITLSAQVFTFPYLIIVFKDFSMNFIIGNLVLMAFIDFIVILGNILIPVYNITPIFDFISYVCLKVINLLDWIMVKLDMWSFPMFYGNRYAAFFYLWIIIGCYFFHKGYKKFICLPAISIVVIIVTMYSPVLNIEYYREGALLISYRGERALVTSAKKEIDIDRLSKVSNASKSYAIEDNINFKHICSLKVVKKDYILKFSNKKVILNISGRGTYNDGCDIINFKDGPNNRIFIVGDKIVETCS